LFVITTRWGESEKKSRVEFWAGFAAPPKAKKKIGKKCTKI